VRPTRIFESLDAGKVVIVAGYQGVSREKEITTLGRGGSDTTAVALAAALEAEVCEICSDVDGVFSADPRVVDGAKRLSELTHEEMQELALAGAKVLNAQAVEFARDRGITIWARSTFQSGPGTKVVPRRGPRELRIAGVAQESDLLVVRAQSALAQVVEALSKNSAWPREIWSEGGFTRAIVPLENVHGVEALVRDLRALAGVEVIDGLALVSIVGTGVGTAVEPLQRALVALGEAPRGVHVAPLRLSFLVPRESAKAAVQRLHAEFVERGGAT
jgi:aspartate kinase